MSATRGKAAQARSARILSAAGTTFLGFEKWGD